jgi:hypothetical protein
MTDSPRRLASAAANALAFAAHAGSTIQKQRRAIIISGSVSGALLQNPSAMLDWIAAPNFLDAYK